MDFGEEPKKKRRKQEYGPFAGAFGLGEEPKPIYKRKRSETVPIIVRKKPRPSTFWKDVRMGASRTIQTGKKIYQKKQAKEYLETRTTGEVSKLRGTDKSTKKLLEKERVKRGLVSQHKYRGARLGFKFKG